MHTKESEAERIVTARMADLKNKFRGCLIGGAIGDALGYPVEFMTMGEIQKTYGSNGIQALNTDYTTGIAQISDDTQMTLFTASGLSWAAYTKETTGSTEGIREGIYSSYLRWLYTQGYAVAPDILIQQPFEAGDAPIGLAFHENPKLACQIAMDAAAITHGHPTGYLAAGAFAYLIAMLVNGERLEAASIECADYMEKRFHDNAAETIHCMRLAQLFAKTDISAIDAIKKIGEGWVAEEALGIALYASLKATDVVDALRIVVNHDGDSDSTGAVCGNLLGAMYGIESFPRAWVQRVELSDFIIDTADKLYDIRKEKENDESGFF